MKEGMGGESIRRYKRYKSHFVLFLYKNMKLSLGHHNQISSLISMACSDRYFKKLSQMRWKDVCDVGFVLPYRMLYAKAIARQYKALVTVEIILHQKNVRKNHLCKLNILSKHKSCLRKTNIAYNYIVIIFVTHPIYVIFPPFDWITQNCPIKPKRC